MKIPVIYWIRELKKQGIENFEFKNLPQELKDKSVMLRAENRGYIKSIGKNGRVSVWSVAQERPRRRNVDKTRSNI